MSVINTLLFTGTIIGLMAIVLSLYKGYLLDQEYNRIKNQ